MLTVEIGGEKDVTCTKICSVVECTIIHNRINEEDTPIVKLIKKKASNYFEKNFDALRENYEVLAFFNPLSKNYDGFSHIDKQKAFDRIREIILLEDRNICNEDSQSKNVNTSQTNRDITDHSSVLDIFNDVNQTIEFNSNCEEEFDRYVSYKINVSKIDLLDWWSEHALHFPRLYNHFLRNCGTPASSAPSERLFSLASNFLTVKRNKLSNNTLNDLLFMNINMN